MAMWRRERPPEYASVHPRVLPRSSPYRRHTPIGPVTIDLLRRLDRFTPVPQGSPPERRSGGPLDRGRDRCFIFVATRPLGDTRDVLGRLDLRLYGDEEGDGNRPCRGTIDRVVVEPRCRRLGIGTQLLRAAIRFARANDIVALRACIPNLLALEDGASACRWALYAPAPGELGGLRSLGVAAVACALERQPCTVVGAIREIIPLCEGRRQERIGGIVDLPIASTESTPPGQKRVEAASDADTLLAVLQAEIAHLARAPWPADLPAARA